MTGSGGTGRPVDALAPRASFSTEETQRSNIHRVRSSAWCVTRSVVSSRRSSRNSARRALASLMRRSSCFTAYCVEGLEGKSRSYSAGRLRAVAKADSSREYRCCRQARRFALLCRASFVEMLERGTQGEDEWSGDVLDGAKGGGVRVHRSSGEVIEG